VSEISPTYQRTVTISRHRIERVLDRVSNLDAIVERWSTPHAGPAGRRLARRATDKRAGMLEALRLLALLPLEDDEPVPRLDPELDYPAGHGWTPGTTPFDNGKACRVSLGVRLEPCDYSREQHDPNLPPVDLDVFGRRRR
jgi:hypothetical protein